MRRVHLFQQLRLRLNRVLGLGRSAPLRTAGLFLSFCLLPACAFKSMVIDHFDKVAMYQIDSYLDLHSEQKQAIEGPLQETIAWAKREKLKEVLALVEELQKAAAARSISPSLIDEVFQKVTAWRSEITGRLARPAASLLQTLDEEQISHLEKKLKKSNRKYEDLLSEDEEDFPEELADFAGEQLRRLKPWYGRLNAEQSALYMQALHLSRGSIEQQLAGRKALQGAWLKLLREHNEPKTLQFIEKWGAGADDDILAPELRQAREDGKKRWREFWIALHKNLSPEQWEQLEERLGETAQDLKKILQKQAAP